MTPAQSRRELATGLVFATFVAVFRSLKSYHMDQPAFLAVARNILNQPWHPLSFLYNWYGTTKPEWQLNTNPLTFPYLLAGALKITGGGEIATRMLFLPFDLAAAAALYFLAGRFLARPLGPV